MVLALSNMDPAFTDQIARWALASRSFVSRSFGFNPILRALGMDWPSDAETMVGLYRLHNLQQCIANALECHVAGDLAEAGVWRGGASIFMRAALKAYDDKKRRVWVADSFQGLPKADPVNYPADRGIDLWAAPQLAIPLETVQSNFARYGLLDEQVRFLPGWFRETLPTAPIDRIAVLRLDGDLYESTMIALRQLYPKVSPGGFVIVDDYNSVPACRQAVEDFRHEFDISDPLYPIDWTGVYWEARG